MPLPVRSLPVLQNWDCQGCTNCCREYRVFVTDEERQRIEGQNWQQEPDLAGLQLFIRGGRRRAPDYHLNHVNGACIFLSAEGRCRIHERFGSAAKPSACRLYPFVLVPVGDHWRVGLRYTCPSSARSQGKPLGEHIDDLRAYATELEKRESVRERDQTPPPLQGRQAVDWKDLLAFNQAILAILKNRGDRMERRWRKCLALADICRKAKFDQVTGTRLTSFLNLVCGSLDTDVPTNPKALARPGWVGRILFRMSLAAHLRKDQGPDAGMVRGRLALIRAATKFALGRGPVPRLHALLPDVTFEQVEQQHDPLGEAAEQMLERYYLVKVGSMQFCGLINSDMPFWVGLESLALTFPILCWLIAAQAELLQEEAAARALAIVDHSFGFSPLLGARRQRFALNILARQGELGKLIAWYGR
jgi:lysine-N-methylase